MKFYYKEITLFIMFFVNSFSLFIQSKSIAVIGTGYVGLVTGACLSILGNKVICVDIDETKINNLKKGIIPIYEEGLNNIVEQTVKENLLSFSTNIENAILHSEIIIIAVGTPMNEDGSANIKAVEAAAKVIGKNLNNYKIICTKSTVPVGTNLHIKKIIRSENNEIEFDIVSNPEFLKEGVAIKDFFNPDRIILGVENEKSLKVMQELYEPFIKKGIPFVNTNLNTAEMIKYAANSFLAMKVSFINEIADLSDKLNSDVKIIAKGIGLDDRIGQKFLYAGPGFGGSCFPKDVLALINQSNVVDINLELLQSILISNKKHQERIVNNFISLFDNAVEGKTITILGLSFKANTDDIRFSPAITIINKLLEKKSKIKAYDPKGMANMSKEYPEIVFCQSAYEALEDSGGLILLTEWEEFKQLDFKKIKSIMANAIIYDTRNILNKNELLSLGFNYKGLGIQ